MPNAQFKAEEFYCSVTFTILLIQFEEIYKQNVLTCSCAFHRKWSQRIHFSSILNSILMTRRNDLLDIQVAFRFSVTHLRFFFEVNENERKDEKANHH